MLQSDKNAQQNAMTLKIIGTAILCVCCLQLSIYAAAEKRNADISVNEITIYGIYDDDTRVFTLEGRELHKGDKYVLEGWNAYQYDPDVIDVLIELENIGNTTEKDVEVYLTISPKICRRTNIEGTSIASQEKCEETAMWFPPIFMKKKTIPEFKKGNSNNVKFANINLARLINQITKKGTSAHWPMFFRFSAYAIPVGEDQYKNNLFEKELKVEPFD